MTKSTDKLQMLKARFEKEKKVGDLSEATRRAKVSNPAASAGLAKEFWKDLTDAERKSLICLTKILNERQQEDAEISEALISSNV